MEQIKKTETEIQKRLREEEENFKQKIQREDDDRARREAERVKAQEDYEVGACLRCSFSPRSETVKCSST